MRTLVAVGLLVTSAGFGADGGPDSPLTGVHSTPTHATGPLDVASGNDLLTRGDRNDREILRFHRISVERQEVLANKMHPFLCRQGNLLVLAAGSGKVAHSHDGGATRQQAGRMPIADGRLRALMARRTMVADSVSAGYTTSRRVR